MSTLTSKSTGRTWTVQPLTPAQGKAYKRTGAPAPRFAAHSPRGSIIRAATMEALAAAVSRSVAP
jgi:hypothetical protein